MGVPSLDGLVPALLFCGAVIGLALAGVVWLVVWLLGHVEITWIW